MRATQLFLLALLIMPAAEPAAMPQTDGDAETRALVQRLTLDDRPNFLEVGSWELSLEVAKTRRPLNSPTIAT